MPQEPIRLLPLLCGLFIGIQLVAVATMLVQRQKRKIAGEPVRSLRDIFLSSALPGLIVPALLLWKFGGPLSALIGFGCGASLCAVALLIFERRAATKR